MIYAFEPDLDKMKYIALILIFLFSAVGFAQIDKSNTVKVPGGLLKPAAEESSFLKLKGNHSLSNNRDNLFKTEAESPKLGEKEERTFSMRTDDGLMKFVPKDYTPKAFTKDKEIKEEFGNDQYLGDFTTGGDFVELYCRDHEYVDGDKVQIIVNDEIIHYSVTLGAGYTPILVKLKPGLNTIEFHALNQGTSGPNTAELRVFDDQGLEAKKQEWNLLKGYKASMIVVKK